METDSHDSIGSALNDGNGILSDARRGASVSSMKAEGGLECVETCGGLGSANTDTTAASSSHLFGRHREGNERTVRLLASLNGSLPHPRIYEVWPQLGGQSRPACRGRCITGPKIDLWYSCCAWSSIVIPSILYFVICADWLWKNLSPCLPIFTGLVFVSTIMLLLLTSCSDPGIIPRQSLQRAVPGLAEEVAAAIGAGPPIVDEATWEPTTEVLTGQQVAQGYRWCPTCKVIRPPRASHCRDCDQCVLTWDHHCPFVHNCVGQRNYAYFSGFLCSTLCLGVAVFSGMGLYFYYTSSSQAGSTILSGPGLYIFIAIIGVPIGVLALGVLGLSTFHACLCCLGRTTKEAYNSFKGQATTSGRTLLAWRAPSLLHLRDRVSVPLTVV